MTRDKETIEVTARFDRDGKIIPLSFTYQGQTNPIGSTGRRWEDAEGQHILVMGLGERVFELIFMASEARWYLGGLNIDRLFV